jgi:GNAT superfamily N-acetyltransferase
MFQDMGELPEAMFDALRALSRSWTERAIQAGEYIGWLATAKEASQAIVGGAGVQLRQAPPHPRLSETGAVTLAKGAHAIVLNVFVEPKWRRQGLGALLMQHVIEWAQSIQLDRLVLHSSSEGRHLYERLGFVSNNEMRYAK